MKHFPCDNRVAFLGMLSPWARLGAALQTYQDNLDMARYLDTERATAVPVAEETAS